jgi:hypothetical protein
LWQGLAKLSGSKTEEAKISIIKDVSGIIKPGRYLTKFSTQKKKKPLSLNKRIVSMSSNIYIYIY